MRKSNGQFAEGNSGRPKGSKNKSTEQIREFIDAFLEDKQDEVLDAFDQLKPKDKVSFYIDLLQYVLPKMKQVDSNTAGNFSFNNIEPITGMVIK